MTAAKEDLLAPMDFSDIDAVQARIPVRVKGTDYILVSADTAAAVKYRDVSIKAMRFDMDGNPTQVDGGASADPTLVASCLYHRGKTDTDLGPSVSLATVMGFAPKVTEDMAERIKKISPGLETNVTVEALEKQIASLQKKLEAKRKEGTEGELRKNSPSATQT